MRTTRTSVNYIKTFPEVTTQKSNPEPKPHVPECLLDILRGGKWPRAPRTKVHDVGRMEVVEDKAKS